VRQNEAEWKAIESLATKLGSGRPETLRKWIRVAEVEGRPTAGPASESTEVRKVRAESRQLRRVDEVLKAATGFFAAELDRPRR
jgi:transposase